MVPPLIFPFYARDVSVRLFFLLCHHGMASNWGTSSSSSSSNQGKPKPNLPLEAGGSFPPYCTPSLFFFHSWFSLLAFSLYSAALALYVLHILPPFPLLLFVSTYTHENMRHSLSPSSPSFKLAPSLIYFRALKTDLIRLGAIGQTRFVCLRRFWMITEQAFQWNKIQMLQKKHLVVPCTQNR